MHDFDKKNYLLKHIWMKKRGNPPDIRKPEKLKSFFWADILIYWRYSLKTAS